jgi:hypothetical protein
MMQTLLLTMTWMKMKKMKCNDIKKALRFSVLFNFDIMLR